MTRILCFCLVFAIVSIPVYAAEVELSTKGLVSQRQVGILGDSISYTVSRSAPEGAKAPEGRCLWGTLKVGESSYVCCAVVGEKGQATFYVDRDGDKDLTKEAGISCFCPPRVRSNLKQQFTYAVVENIDGKFKINGMDYATKLNLKVWPIVHGRVCSNTCYSAEIDVFGEKVPVMWVPGNYPSLMLKEARGFCRGVVNGRKRLVLERSDVSVRDGKVYLNYEAKEDKTLVGVKVPGELERIVTSDFKDGIRSATIYLPEGGKVYMPAGSTGSARASLVRKDGEDIWDLAITLSRQPVVEGAEFGEFEALQVEWRNYNRQGKLRISPSLVDAQGRRLCLMKNGESFEKPKLVIKDSAGKVIATEYIGFC